MTDEELAAIRERLDGWQYGTLTITSAGGHTSEAYNARHAAPGDIQRLLAEVERLRVRVAAEEHDRITLEQMGHARDAENTAMREIVQAVAHGTLAHYEDDTPYCLYCTQEYRYPAGITHTPACPVTKARALLGDDTPR